MRLVSGNVDLEIMLAQRDVLLKDLLVTIYSLEYNHLER